MHRLPLIFLLILAVSMLSAQSGLVITQVIVNVEGEERPGRDVTALVTNSPARGQAILYEVDDIRISAWVRTNTHHVGRGSSEQGTVGIAIVLDFVAYGHREKRELGRTFRPNDARTWRVSEKFRARTGDGTREIVVSFVGQVEQ